MYNTFRLAHDRNGQDRRRRSSARKVLFWSIVGLLSGVLAESAQAQIVINGVGSSAGREAAGAAPVFMCSGPTPPNARAIHMRSGTTDSNSNRHTWICNVTQSVPSLGINFVNQPTVIRYSVSESSHGYTRLTGQYGTPQTAPYIIDTSSCLLPVTRTVLGLTFDEYSSCTQQSTQFVNFGASDVQAGSFGQSGPTGLSFPPAGQPPVDDSTLSNETVAAQPFALFVNNGVRLQTPTGGLGGVLENLSRPQIEMIFRRNARNWTSLGYVVTSDNVTINPSEKGITLCLREAGSGSKAAFDQTKLVQTGEVVVLNNTGNGTGGSIIYSPTSSGVRTCIQNNVNGIGYLAAETVVANAHPIQINGYSANYAVVDPTNTSPIARKRDVACGRYQFWTDWRIIRRTAQDGTPTNNMIRAFAEATKTETLGIPSWSHWVALDDMNVSKTLDAGPISLNGGLTPPANPECRP